jgi:hypothetical protein
MRGNTGCVRVLSGGWRPRLHPISHRALWHDAVFETGLSVEEGEMRVNRATVRSNTAKEESASDFIKSGQAPRDKFQKIS